MWVLGFVSLLMDLSSEIYHALLPAFLTVTLGLPVAAMGAIDGIAEGAASFAKLGSGRLSDRSRRRKPWILAGYGLAALSKPLFPLAASAWAVMGARFADRVGKGIRGAPRDALVADIAPTGMRGAAFGLRQSLDTIGAFLGPVLAIVLMLLWAGDVRAVFWVAVIPAVLSVAVLVAGVQEPEPQRTGRREWPIRRDKLRELGGAYWWVVGIGAVFTLARFSEAFLVLRAQQGGLPMAWAPLVLIAMNAVYAAGAYPLGRLADRMNHRTLLAIGLGVLVAADALLAIAGQGPLLWAGILLWGLHMAMTQGLLAAMVADAAPPALRGTAFGMFNLASGVALLVASALAGLLWDRWGAPATFVLGAAFSVVALGVLGVRSRSAR